ncbi:MAG TPA: hypothetical protein VN494_09905 [Patescibacteria group bacterium]|nr:hypothetical protein [Patescibacteria group bacterium]
MSFREEFPDYDQYRDGPLYYTTVPAAVVAPVKRLILRVARSTQYLKTICNDVASCVPCEPIRHVGWDWLVNDLGLMLEQLIRKKLYKFMDFIYEFTCRHGDAAFVEDLNDIFNAHHFGYRMILDDSGPGPRHYWKIHKEPERTDKSITAAWGS